MCGRFTLRNSADSMAEAFALPEMTPFGPRYNVAPTQVVPTVSLVDGKRAVVPRRWGLVPSWANDLKIGNSLLNARAETVADKPAFRSAFKRSRCLVVADGFYEWRKDGKVKQPFFIRMRDDRPFAFAGLAERWSKGEQPVESCTIITTDPNPLMATIHDRMPVILPPDVYDVWLDPEFQGRERLTSLLVPYPADEMIATPVSSFVNSPKNQGPECTAAV